MQPDLEQQTPYETHNGAAGITKIVLTNSALPVRLDVVDWPTGIDGDRTENSLFAFWAVIPKQEFPSQTLSIKKNKVQQRQLRGDKQSATASETKPSDYNSLRETRPLAAFTFPKGSSIVKQINTIPYVRHAYSLRPYDQDQQSRTQVQISREASAHPTQQPQASVQQPFLLASPPNQPASSQPTPARPQLPQLPPGDVPSGGKLQDRRHPSEHVFMPRKSDKHLHDDYKQAVFNMGCFNHTASMQAANSSMIMAQRIEDARQIQAVSLLCS